MNQTKNWHKNFDSVQTEEIRLYRRPTLESEVLKEKTFFLQMSQKIEVLHQPMPRNEKKKNTRCICSMCSNKKES